MIAKKQKNVKFLFYTNYLNIKIITLMRKKQVKYSLYIILANININFLLLLKLANVV